MTTYNHEKFGGVRVIHMFYPDRNQSAWFLIDYNSVNDILYLLLLKNNYKLTDMYLRGVITLRINTDKNIKSNKKGFTLVETLVVMSIIAALAALIMLIFSASIDKAKEARDIADFRSAKINARIILMDGHMDTIKFADLVAQLKGVTSTVMQNISKPNKTNVGKAIAANIGQEIVIDGEFITIPGIAVPGASKTSVSVNSTSGNVYLNASHVSREEGERLAQALGYGKLATPSEVASDPSLKNENIYWSSGHLSVGGHGGKPAGHLSILLYKP